MGVGCAGQGSWLILIGWGRSRAPLPTLPRERGRVGRGPARRGAFGDPGGRLAPIYPHPLHPPGIRVENLDLERTLARYQFAAHRHPANQRDDITADGVDLLGGIADVEFRADYADCIFVARAARRNIRSIRLTDDGLLP